MLELFISKMARDGTRKGALAATAKYFTRSTEDLDSDIRNHLKLTASEPYAKKVSNKSDQSTDKYQINYYTVSLVYLYELILN